MSGRTTRPEYSFTDGVREALAIARVEAVRLRHAYVGTEHVLLGLIGRRDADAARMLTALGLDVAEVRANAERALGVGDAPPPMKASELPYSNHAKKSFDLAIKQARAHESSVVGAEHLLLALFANEKSRTCALLRDAGLQMEDVVVYIKTGSSPRPAFRIEVDDKSEKLIWEQIVTKVQEAIATGRLIPGQRLPPVRQLADDLGIAPGTVSRAYSALEESGVVTTEGARGTFVARRETPHAGSKERSAAVQALLRQVVVAAFHLGATADELRKELEQAMKDIYGKGAAA